MNIFSKNYDLHHLFHGHAWVTKELEKVPELVKEVRNNCPALFDDMYEKLKEVSQDPGIANPHEAMVKDKKLGPLYSATAGHYFHYTLIIWKIGRYLETAADLSPHVLLAKGTFKLITKVGIAIFDHYGFDKEKYVHVIGKFIKDIPYFDPTTSKVGDIPMSVHSSDIHDTLQKIVTPSTLTSVADFCNPPKNT